MKVKTISCRKIFFTGLQYLNEHIEMQAELEEGEDAVEKYFELREKVMQCAPKILEFAPTDKNSYDGGEYSKLFLDEVGKYPQPSRTTENPIPKTKEERNRDIARQIATVTNLDVLKQTYSLLAKTYPEIQEAYDKKLKELSK